MWSWREATKDGDNQVLECNSGNWSFRWRAAMDFSIGCPSISWIFPYTWTLAMKLFHTSPLFVVVQLFSCVHLFVTPRTAVHQASLSFTFSRSLLKLMSIKLVMSYNHLILRCPLLLLTSIFPSIQVFSNESALHIRWPNYWSSSFSISPSNEYSGLIYFRMDWLDPLAVQGTLKSLLHHPSPKASIL